MYGCILKGQFVCLHAFHECISMVSTWQSVCEDPRPPELTAVPLWPPPTHIHLFLTKAQYNAAPPVQA